jgi:hypothetical protein
VTSCRLLQVELDLSLHYYTYLASYWLVASVHDRGISTSYIC